MPDGGILYDLLTIRLLLVEDSEDDFILVQSHLEEVEMQNYEITWVTDHDQAIEAARADNFDLHIYDYHIGAETGLELLTQMRAERIQAPVIILTGQTDLAIDLEAIRSGASDYLHKDEISGPLLSRTINYALERRRNEQKLVNLAELDSLTGLANRSIFMEYLRHAVARTDRQKNHVGLLFLDLDRFKTINDSLGHAAGDQLLVQVAERLTKSIRASDMVCRLGGDEFTVILEGVGRTEIAAHVAEKILAALAASFSIDGHDIYVNASIGIALYPGGHAGVDELVKNADMAMYRAKEKPGSHFEFHTDEMTERAHDRLAVERDLRYAIENDQLVLLYQPQLCLRTGDIIGVEALVRWIHPEKGMMAPDRFIPIAEETGLIVPLGAWVLRTACAQNMAWVESGLPERRVAVNLSAKQFQNHLLPDQVWDAISASGMDPAYLELELTEGHLAENAVDAAETLSALKTLGVHVSIDDFGTGYSSLSHLKRFPVDALKIDRSFGTDLPGDLDDVAITKAILSIGKSLNMEVVAEGVENEEQLEFLRELGCDYVQGYFLSRPLPADELAVWMAGRNAGPLSVPSQMVAV